MNNHNLLELALFVGGLLVTAPLLGAFLARLFQQEETLPTRVFAPLERALYRVMGTSLDEEMSWKQYSVALIAFNLVGVAVVFLLQLVQHSLPLNPQALANIGWDSALNTAVSFVTNTNWQGYAGEVSMSYFTQMVGLTVQNFVSAATGMAVVAALARGISRKNTQGIGNFWVDLTRSTLYVLLPLSLVFSIFLVGQGIIQNFQPYQTATTLEGAQQVLPMGPAASQVAIKMIGTNGGGFFNANAAHPFENPTPLSNFLQMLMIFLIPSALVYAFGQIVSARRHAWVIWGVMMALFLGLLAVSLASEYSTNSVLQVAGAMEGKETRFSVFESVLFSVITTAASCGAVNAMHSSLSPLSGMVTMINMMLGEIIFGGVGAGFYGMMLFVLLTVFMAGLMVGRTPEYLGKKIEKREITMVILGILAPSACILLGTAVSVVLPAGLSSTANPGPHGFSEILYAFTSASANNGSAFAGLSANTLYYNLLLAFAMFVGRFGVIVPILAVAGSFAAKKTSPPSPGTFKVDTALFGILLIGVVLIVGGLTFFPALSLGPIVEHFLMRSGRVF
jgi:potassium-transporting ATPase potassium-binding subunit